MPDKRAPAFQQAQRALVIARKDIRIYYSKGPVVIFGLLFPVFLFLSFMIGRHFTADFMIPGLLGMVVFFTATSISPIVVPWEAQARTLERLMSCPVRIETIILGDILASFAFGLGISLLPIIIGLCLGVSISSPVLFALAVVLSAFCFASLGQVFSIPPTSLPSTVNMISSVVKFPVVFISGVFVVLEELPGWGQVIAYFSPLTYFVDIARRSMGNSGHINVAIDILALMVFTALFLGIALWAHRQTMAKRI